MQRLSDGQNMHNVPRDTPDVTTKCNNCCDLVNLLVGKVRGHYLCNATFSMGLSARNAFNDDTFNYIEHIRYVEKRRNA